MANLKKTHVIRAVTFPVAGPVGAAWKELDEALRGAWSAATALCNWAVTELAKGDVVRTSRHEKLPKADLPYLYGLAVKRYPDWKEWGGAKASAQCVLRSVEKKYRAKRLEVVWRHSASLPTYRYPQPYPVHNQNWSARYSKRPGDDVPRDGCPLVAFKIGDGSWTLRLREGPEFGRQLGQFRQIVSGEAKPCEMAVYRRGKHTLVKLVAWFPRRQPGHREHTMLVRTDPNAFWVAELEGRAPWIVNADHVRRWQAVHAAYRQRLSEDLKYEKRWPAKQRRHMVESLDRRCRKQRDRLKTWCDQASAMLAGYAERNRVGEVIYDDADAGYLPSFPWFMLREMVSRKLVERGIVCTSKKEKAHA